MGYLDNDKITSEERAVKQIRANQPDKLTGTAYQNKNVFDIFSDFISDKHNSALTTIEEETLQNDDIISNDFINNLQ